MNAISYQTNTQFSETSLLTNQDSFKKYVIGSLLFHILIVSFFSIKAIFFSGVPIDYQAAIKVDLVALPDKTDPNLAKDIENIMPETKVEKLENKSETIQKIEITKNQVKMPEKALKSKVKEPDAINLDKTKSKQEAALAKLKAMSALEEIEKQVSEENTKKMIKQIKGNQLSSGSELTGLSKIQHDSYISDVERHIRKNWQLPEWLANKNLKAQVRVLFDSQGQIIAKEITKSSGHPSFDEVVLLTIQNSNPVPTPPEKFVKIMSVEGILFGFPE